jgi:hypothetical protein
MWSKGRMYESLFAGCFFTHCCHLRSVRRTDNRVGNGGRSEASKSSRGSNLDQSMARLLPLTILSAVLLLASGFYLAATTSAFRQG